MLCAVGSLCAKGYGCKSWRINAVEIQGIEKSFAQGLISDCIKETDGSNRLPLS